MNGQHIKDTLKNNGVKVAQVATTLGMTRQRMNSLLNCDDIKVGTLGNFQRVYKKIGAKLVHLW